VGSERITPSQTIGPFFHPGTAWATKRPAGLPGPDEYRVEGVVTDAEGAGVSDALIEIWQPGRSGGDDALACGFQRAASDEAGGFAFLVRRRGDGPAVAHVTVFARGLNGALRTRLYLDASVDDLARLPELRAVPPARLVTLLPSSIDSERRVARWPLRLRGEGETVFFALRP
jgi:protocatechuate 3,4-dioxygenase alpha subunit